MTLLCLTNVFQKDESELSKVQNIVPQHLILEIFLWEEGIHKWFVKILQTVWAEKALVIVSNTQIPSSPPSYVGRVILDQEIGT